MQAIQITDGRTSLWQWDTGVSIKVYGCTDVDQMHFVTPAGVISKELVDGECGVPDTAMQTEGLLKMYAFDRTENGGVTRCDFLLMVKARPKPADYIDPPDEYDNLEELAKRIAPLIPGGGGSVTPEQIGAAVEEYLAENPIEGEPGPQGPQGERGEQGHPGADGSDATVTAENVTAALGYTPADKETVKSLSEEIAAISGGQEITARVTDEGSVQAFYNGAGALVDNAKALTTDYVEINGQKNVRYYSNVALGNMIVTFFDATKTLLKDDSIIASGSTSLKREGYAKIPNQAKYARLSSYADDQSYMTLYTATHVLSGKKVAVLGDSISSVDYTLPNYWQMIAENTNCNFVNHGVSASRIAASEGAIASPFVDRYINMPMDADAVIIMGGTNDANNSQLGEWDSTDTATLYGALNTMLPDLCMRYPGKPILFFAPIRGKEETLAGLPPTYADLAEKTATDTLKLRLVRLAIKAKCEQYGIPFIETDKISGINGNDTDGIYYIDALHPSAHGVACLANVVQAELEKRFVYTVD